MLLNDATDAPPALRVYLNLDNLADPPAGFSGPRLDDPDLMERLAADGFEGVQLTHNNPAPDGCLPFCGLDRINQPGEADGVVARHRDRGDQCLTVHAGWGMEDDPEIDRLVEAILTASHKHQLPVFIETHRATITQDMWRTVRITRRFPEVRFNCDLSHYYCGQEMVYGGLEQKMAFMAPIFDRTGFMHGRIAAPGAMQMPIGADLDARPAAATGEIDYLADFRKLWQRALAGFLGIAVPGDVLIFAPELLSPRYYYARDLPNPDGSRSEECDRYQQALLYARLIRQLFAELAR
jgi:hypothetical protein